MADNRDWIMCQQYSDQMLADGLLTLRDQPATEHTSDVSKEPGNYVVSLDGDALYVGEAKNLAKRTRQQFRQKTSTFFKTFLTRNTESSVPIHRFHLRCTETQVGRKELEEFGIVNVPCRLNKFQLGKRSVIAASSATGGWCELQQHYAGILAQGERELLAQSFVRWSAAPPLRRSAAASRRCLCRSITRIRQDFVRWGKFGCWGAIYIAQCEHILFSPSASCWHRRVRLLLEGGRR